MKEEDDPARKDSTKKYIDIKLKDKAITEEEEIVFSEDKSDTSPG